MKENEGQEGGIGGALTLTMGQPAPQESHFTIKDSEYGERYFMKAGDGYVEVTKPGAHPVRPHADRKYNVNDMESLVTVAETIGDPVDGIVFFNDAGVTLFFEEASRQERVSLPFAASLEFRAFLGAGEGRTFDQKAFLKLLETFPECVENAALLVPKVERFSLSTSVEIVNDINPDNITFTYKESAGTQTERLPKKLKLTLPYFERSENTIEILCDLDIARPKDETQKPTFTLANPKAKRTAREALDREIKTLKDRLNEWTFVHGVSA